MYRFLFLLAALVPSFAFADMSLMPNSSDITVKYFINSIFGTLANLGGGVDPIAGVLGKFNSVVLFVGAILLGYTLVAGTMQTAHDGEVLGKKWSSMWVPIRTSLGIAAIVPVGSGYCVIQYVVMWLVLQGVGAANLVWTTYSASSDPLAEIAIMQSNGKGAEIADIVLQQQLCSVVINSEILRAKNTAAANGITNVIANAYGQVNVDPLGNSTGETVVNNNFEKNTCGGYEILPPNTAPNTLLRSWFGETFSQVNFSGKMSTTHSTAFINLSNDMYELASKIYMGAFESPVAAKTLGKEFKTATDKYNKAIEDGARSAISSVNSTNDVAKHASRDGWGMAGAWYMKYVYVQNAINKEVSRYPKVTPPNISAVPSEFKPAVADFVERYNAIRKYTSYQNELGVETMLRADKSSKSSKNDEEDPSKISEYLNEKYGTVLNAPTKYLGQSMVGDKNPVLAAKDFGDYVFTTTSTATIGLAVVAGFLPTSSVVLITPLLFALTGALMGFSSILAFYLPIAPFIIWFGVLIGWLVMVVEAVIAAPLWAIAHVHPDGDGVVGRAGQGYSLILGLTLRPVLAVLGLIAAMVLVIPVGQLFNRTYWAVFDMSQGDSTQLLFTFAACISIFSVTYLAMINRIFSLIHVIPDQILRYMGGPASDLGSYAGELGGASSKNAGMVGGIAGGMAGNVLQGAQSVKQRQLQQQTNKETTAAKIEQQRGNEIAKQNATQEGENQYGTGMGTARMKGSDAVRAAMENAAKENKPSPSSSDLENIRQSATVDGFNDVHGDENAWQARQDFGDARAKVGLGEPTASEHNKFMRDRNAVEARHPGSFSPETYVNNTLARKSASRAPTAPTAEPAKPPEVDPGAKVE